MRAPFALRRAAVLGTTLALVVSATAMADGVNVDGDLVTPGNQNSVTLTVAAGSTVNLTVGLRVDWNGNKHLAPGSAITIIDAGAPQTTLPAGYTVGTASGTVPNSSSWNSNDDDFALTSSVSFTAPATADDYTYTIKYDPGTYTCEDGDDKCLNVAGAFTVNLTVEEGACTTDWEVQDFRSPFDESSPTTRINNTMKNGRVVPVKVVIYDECTDTYLTDPTASVLVNLPQTETMGVADPVETYADAGASSGNTRAFRWSDDGFWIYNLDSKGLGLTTGKTYRVDVWVGAVGSGDKATSDLWGVLTPVK